MYNKRQQAILAYLAKHEEASNADLMEAAGSCSVMTQWRDLKELEEDGKIFRYRGGASLIQDGTTGDGREINFNRRIRQNTGAKESIAQIAASLITPDRSYYLDAGSTIFTLTRFLRDGNYYFVTSAANTAAELAQRMHCEVTLLGGQVNMNTLSCSGEMAEHFLARLSIDIAVMASSGYVLGSSFTSGQLAEASLKKKVIEKAGLTIMLMDSGKLTRRHPFTFASLSDIDLVICDEDIPEAFREECRENGIPCFVPGDGMKPEERLAVLDNLLSR